MISAAIASLILGISPAAPAIEPPMFSIAVSAFCVQDGEPGDEPSEEPDVPEEPGQDPEEGEDESPGTGTEGEGEGETEEEEVPRIPLEAILTVPSRAKEAKACSGCSATERVTLCGEHAEAENAAFEILATTWGDLDDHQKVDTLVEISNLTSQHVNAPSPRVATFLVERLKDERSGYVRAASAIALGWGQDPAIALPPLMKILKDRQKKNPKLRSKLQKLTDEFYSRSAMVVQLADYLEATGFQLTQAGAEGLEQDLKHLLPLIKELEKASTHYIWEEHMLAASAQAIGRIPDRRCAKALLKAASTWDARMALDGIAEGLLANGTRSCVRAAIKSLDDLEKEVNALDKQIKKVRSGKAGQAPKGYEGGNVAWRRWYEDARAGSLETLGKGRERQQELIGKRLSLLRSFAESKGLEPPARSNRGPYIRWNVWLAKNQDAFPKKLAGK